MLSLLSVGKILADEHIRFENPSVRIDNTGGIMTYGGQEIRFYWADGNLYNPNFSINNDYIWRAKAVGGIKLINGNNAEVDEMELTATNNSLRPVRFKGEGSIIVTVDRREKFNNKDFHSYYVITVPYTSNHIWDLFSNVTPRTNAQWVDTYKNKQQHPIRVVNDNLTNLDGYDQVNGTNAYFIPETAGLIFDAKENNFGYNNADRKLVTWGGKRGNGDKAHLTIPSVQGGMYIKIWWDAMDEGRSGAHFTVNNLLDLEGTEITNEFGITGVHTSGKCEGVTIFKVKGNSNERKDITFKLTDEGWNDLYKIEVTDKYSTDMILVDQMQNNQEVLYDLETGNLVFPESELNHTHYYTNDGDRPYMSFIGASGYAQVHRAKTCEFEVVQEPVNGVVSYVQREWTSTNSSYYNLDITEIKGTGNVKIIQREYFNGYVLDKKETWIAIGTYTQQSYPYTWDFTEYNVNKANPNLLQWLSGATGVDYGHWMKQGESYSLETHKPVDATKANNNFEWNNVQIHKPLFAQGSQLTNGLTAINETKGLRVKQYIRKDGEDLIAVGEEYDGEIKMDGTALKFTPNTPSDPNLDHRLKITIPQVEDGMYVFVKANQQPNVYKGNTKINSTNTYANANDVGAYPVSGTGDIDLYFDQKQNIEIYSIGVTNITKPVNKYGYATESRNRTIDHTYTGKFTSNDVNAYIMKNYDGTQVTMVETDVIAENTGIVMYKSSNTSQFNAPLFVNACNVTADTTDGNLLKPNVSASTLDKTSGSYTNFVLTDISYHIKDMTSKPLSGEENIGFYRVGQSGTLGANKSYLQLPTSDLNTEAGAKGVVFLLWDDEEEITGITTQIDDASLLIDNGQLTTGHADWYNLNGQKLSGKPSANGLYIMNGKKVMVK